MPPMSSPNDLAMNMPNQSMMYSTFTSTFGNLGFQIAPSQTGEVNFDYGTLPYFSLEALIYMQQVSSATQPEKIIPGQSQGQSNVSGLITVTDPSGNVTAEINGGTASTSTVNSTTPTPPAS